MNNSRTIKVILYPRKDKDGLFPVKIRITQNRKSHYKNLKFSIEKKYWLKTDRVSVSHPKHKELNFIIDKELNELNSVDNYVNVEVLFGKLNLFNDLEKKINGYSKQYYHSKKKYRTLYYHLYKFWGNEDLFYYDLDKEFYKDFKNYLFDNVKPSSGVSKTPSNNTINSYLKYLKTFLLEVVEKDGVKVKDIDTIRKLFSSGVERKKTPLSHNEIKVLNNILPSYPFMRELLFNSLNTFMSNFWSNGLRIGDCLRLKWGSISDGVISVQMSKTKNWVHIPLNENNSWRIFWYIPNFPKQYNWETREWYNVNNSDITEGVDEFLELNFNVYLELLLEYEQLKDDFEDDSDYFLSDNNLHIRGNRYSVEFDDFVRDKLKGKFPFDLLEKNKQQFTKSLIHRIEMISMDEKMKNKYIFPFLWGFENENNLDVINNRISSSISLINKSLKEIGRNVGITKNLHNHLSRHSLTSISISLGTDVYSMKTMLGHKSVRQTESYINTINDVETSTKNVNRINDMLNNK
jgi:integrase